MALSGESAHTPAHAVLEEPTTSIGDVRAAAAHRIERSYSTPPEHHAALEPHATVAAWEDGRLTAHDTSQYPYGVKELLARRRSGCGCWRPSSAAGSVARPPPGRTCRWRPPHSWRAGRSSWSSRHLRECYELGAKAFGWASRIPAPGALREGYWLIGYGMAAAVYRSEMSSAVVAGLPSEVVSAARESLVSAVTASHVLPDRPRAMLLSTAREAFTAGFQLDAVASAAAVAGMAVTVAVMLRRGRGHKRT